MLTANWPFTSAQATSLLLDSIQGVELNLMFRALHDPEPPLSTEVRTLFKPTNGLELQPTFGNSYAEFPGFFNDCYFKDKKMLLKTTFKVICNDCFP